MAIDFEVIHKNFDGIMFDLCNECEGQCEKNEITVFLPNEIKFVAQKLNLNLEEFVERFCNTIEFKENKIYILKAGVCPFLDSEFRCEMEKFNCKLVRCLLYPILIGISENKIKIFVDYKHCPMARRITNNFKNQAFRIYESVKQEIPKWWLEFVSKYDECIYDYSKLKKLRNRKIILMEELEDCIIK